MSSMLDPHNLVPNRDNSAHDAAPHYDRHRLDRRYSYRPSPGAVTLQPPQLEPHAPLSTISHADLRPSRDTPPPHFFSHFELPGSFSSNHTENQRPPSARLPAAQFATPSEIAAQSISNRTPAAPIDNSPTCLILDKDLIFPPPPSQALYSLKYAVSAGGINNLLSQSVPSTQSADGNYHPPAMQDKNLYSITRYRILKDEQFVIQGQRRSTIPGTLEFTRHLNFFGRLSWQCRKEKTKEILIRTKGDHWLDTEGKIIGREEGGVVLGHRKKKAIQNAKTQRAQGMEVPWKTPVLELVGVARDGTDGGKIRHLLVACWVAKCWFTEVATTEQEFHLPQYMTAKNK